MFNKYLKFLIPILMLQNFISCSQTNYNQVDYNFFLNFESDKVLIDVRSDEEISIKSVDEFIYLYKEANSIVSEISSLNNVEFIDLNNLVPKTSEYIYDMIHLTDKGSLLVSEIITNYLKKTSL